MPLLHDPAYRTQLRTRLESLRVNHALLGHPAGRRQTKRRAKHIDHGLRQFSA